MGVFDQNNIPFSTGFTTGFFGKLSDRQDLRFQARLDEEEAEREFKRKSSLLTLAQTLKDESETRKEGTARTDLIRSQAQKAQDLSDQFGIPIDTAIEIVTGNEDDATVFALAERASKLELPAEEGPGADFARSRIDAALQGEFDSLDFRSANDFFVRRKPPLRTPPFVEPIFPTDQQEDTTRAAQAITGAAVTAEPLRRDPNATFDDATSLVMAVADSDPSIITAPTPTTEQIAIELDPTKNATQIVQESLDAGGIEVAGQTESGKPRFRFKDDVKDPTAEMRNKESELAFLKTIYPNVDENVLKRVVAGTAEIRGTGSDRAVVDIATATEKPVLREVSVLPDGTQILTSPVASNIVTDASTDANIAIENMIAIQDMANLVSFSDEALVGLSGLLKLQIAGGPVNLVGLVSPEIAQRLERALEADEISELRAQSIEIKNDILSRMRNGRRIIAREAVQFAETFEPLQPGQTVTGFVAALGQLREINERILVSSLIDLNPRRTLQAPDGTRRLEPEEEYLSRITEQLTLALSPAMDFSLSPQARQQIEEVYSNTGLISLEDLAEIDDQTLVATYVASAIIGRNRTAITLRSGTPTFTPQPALQGGQ